MIDLSNIELQALIKYLIREWGFIPLRRKFEPKFGYNNKIEVSKSLDRIANKQRKISIRISDHGIKIRARNAIKKQTLVEYYPLTFENIIKANDFAIQLNSKFDSKPERDLYIIQNNNNKAVKIGITSDINQRMKDLQTGNCTELTLLTLIENQSKLEKPLHRLLNEHRMSGEWFKEICLYFLPDWIKQEILIITGESYHTDDFISMPEELFIDFDLPFFSYIYDE